MRRREGCPHDSLKVAENGIISYYSVEEDGVPTNLHNLHIVQRLLQLKIGIKHVFDSIREWVWWTGRRLRLPSQSDTGRGVTQSERMTDKSDVGREGNKLN